MDIYIIMGSFVTSCVHVRVRVQKNCVCWRRFLAFPSQAQPTLSTTNTCSLSPPAFSFHLPSTFLPIPYRPSRSGSFVAAVVQPCEHAPHPMRALFSRINKGLSKDREKDRYSSPDSPVLSNREKLPELPPIQEWPPSLNTQRVTPPTSFHSTKPLPDISSRPLPPIDAPPLLISNANSQSSTASSRMLSGPPVLPPAVPVDDTSSLVLGLTTTTVTVTRPHSDSRQDTPDFAFSTRTATPNRRVTDASTATATTAHTVVGDAPGPKKQVAFISPPPTPAPLQRALSEPDSIASNGDALAASMTSHKQPPAPLKTNVSRFQAAHGVDTRASSSKSTKTSTNGKNGKTTAPAISPNSQRSFADNASLNASVRSGTPYSQASQSTSRILATSSWSETAEEDLVSNLGPRERTRQEVLWEIVASEERCVLGFFSPFFKICPVSLKRLRQICNGINEDERYVHRPFAASVFDRRLACQFADAER